jgi:hypothetical protein
VVLQADGTPVGDPHHTYDLALAAIAAELAAPVADPELAEAGLLPDAWEHVPGQGLAFAQATSSDPRDFSQCQFTWRDPAASLLPLMLQTSTEMGHFGAVLAGYIERLAIDGDAVVGGGRFYDTDAGRQFRDMLLGGRRFGVSVDPGAVAAEWECLAEDEDGWCTEELVRFTEYEIIGLTGTPFPAFALAAIQLAGAADAEPAEDNAPEAEPEQAQPAPAAVVASGAVTVPVAPPADWFATPEPQLGEPFALGSQGDEWLVQQDDSGRLAMPLTITDDGRVLGHLAYWGQCHVGYPGACVEPPSSAAAYSHFHVGAVRTAEGDDLATGTLVAGCDHAAIRLRAPDAAQHYDHSGVAWADVRVVDGMHGPWVCGALRPDVTPEQVRVLRASSLSGDWRTVGGQLELVVGLAVNAPGFPVAREAVTASGYAQQPTAHAVAYIEDTNVRALVASGVVRRCADCARNAAAARNTMRVDLLPDGPALDALRAIQHDLERIERRTRHLVGPAAAALAERIRPGG